MNEDLTDTILEFDIFKGDCPLGFGFEENSLEDKAQNVFYEDDGRYCDINCDSSFKKCWIKFFKEVKRLQKLEGKSE